MKKKNNSITLRSTTLAAITAVSLAASMLGPSVAAPKDVPSVEESFVSNGVTEAAEARVFKTQPFNAELNKFTNYAHGYSINIPTNMNVTDMSNSSIVSVLEDEHRKLEIYKDTGINTASYINYTYVFLENTKDHKTEYLDTMTIDGKKVYIKQWSRDKLSRVKGDKNYYASIDILSKDTVYNLFFKSDVPFYECGGYMDIVNSFMSFEPTETGNDLVGKREEKPNWNEETKTFFNRFFSENSDLVWGIYEPAAPHYIENLLDIEYKLNYKFMYTLTYSIVLDKYDSFAVDYGLKNAYKYGRTVELTLQTPNEEMDHNMVYDILDGKYDEFLHSYAKDVASFGHPVLFRPFNEMNGDWCNYSAYSTSRDTQIFKELYKYIYNIFKEEKADENTIWIWNPNGKSFPGFAWNDMSCYYPGDQYTDLVGLTGYNTGTYYPSEKWESFTEIYDELYEKTTSKYSQPLIITEFSCSSVGGDKPEWIRDMFAQIGKYKKIKAAVWWDGSDFDANGDVSRPYFIDETPEVISAFRYYLWKYNWWDEE